MTNDDELVALLTDRGFTLTDDDPEYVAEHPDGWLHQHRVLFTSERDGSKHEGRGKDRMSALAAAALTMPRDVL